MVKDHEAVAVQKVVQALKPGDYLLNLGHVRGVRIVEENGPGRHGLVLVEVERPTYGLVSGHATQPGLEVLAFGWSAGIWVYTRDLTEQEMRQAAQMQHLQAVLEEGTTREEVLGLLGQLKGLLEKTVRPPKAEPERSMAAYVCRTCGHAFFYHRESAEWQRLNPRRKRDLVGCTQPGCECTKAVENK